MLQRGLHSIAFGFQSRHGVPLSHGLLELILPIGQVGRERGHASWENRRSGLRVDGVDDLLHGVHIFVIEEKSGAVPVESETSSSHILLGRQGGFPFLILPARLELHWTFLVGLGVGRRATNIFGSGTRQDLIISNFDILSEQTDNFLSLILVGRRTGSSLRLLLAPQWLQKQLYLAG